ncbi:hypothetical protein SDC9_111295 [bioreactor metagenome]|uniref:L-lysine N(6)-monooxygenase (NADPH) n=1 Tax=bioreactor metagenome TaxID=1076179 RepID=A0A645BG37_9ZZZZ
MLSLSDAQRTQVLARQSSLYKGINASLINDIYDLLDHKISAGDQRYTLMTNAELEACRFDGARHEYMLDFRQVETGQPFRHATDGLVLATGYAPKLPACIHPIRERIVWGADGSYRLAPNYAADINGQEIFVQNGGIASHGITNPDLGFCCWRNSVILQAITGVEHYPIERSTALQDFAPPRSGVLKHRGQRPSMAGDARAPQISHAGLASQFAY